MPYSLCRVCIWRSMSALVGRHLINAFNARNQQSGIHLPPAWRFLLRPRSLGRERGCAASKTSRTVIHRTHWQKHTAASYLHWHANKSSHYKGKTCRLTYCVHSVLWLSLHHLNSTVSGTYNLKIKEIEEVQSSEQTDDTDNCSTVRTNHIDSSQKGSQQLNFWCRLNH